MAEDKKDPPIEAQKFLGGVTVVSIGDVRVARGLSRRAHSSCPHINITYDKKERRIWCEDCERDVEPFDAFLRLTEGYDQAVKDVERREIAVAEAEKFQIRSIAAKKMDEAWRHRNMVPACPHCHGGLFPELFKNRVPLVGKNFAEAQARK